MSDGPKPGDQAEILSVDGAEEPDLTAFVRRARGLPPQPSRAKAAAVQHRTPALAETPAEPSGGKAPVIPAAAPTIDEPASDEPIKPLAGLRAELKAEIEALLEAEAEANARVEAERQAKPIAELEARIEKELKAGKVETKAPDQTQPVPRKQVDAALSGAAPERPARAATDKQPQPTGKPVAAAAPAKAARPRRTSWRVTLVLGRAQRQARRRLRVTLVMPGSSRG